MLLALAEFDSLTEMDGIISPGRFITAFAKRLTKDKDKRVLHLFENDLVFLHSQADALGMSLKNFYDGALEEIKTVQIKCKSPDDAYES